MTCANNRPGQILNPRARNRNRYRYPGSAGQKTGHGGEELLCGFCRWAGGEGKDVDWRDELAHRCGAEGEGTGHDGVREGREEGVEVCMIELNEGSAVEISHGAA